MPMDNNGPTAEQPGSPPHVAPDTATSAVDLAHLQQLSSVHAELTRLEELLCGGHHPVTGAAHTLTHGAKQMHVPAWLRVTRGESRWPVAAMIVVAIALQLALPDRLTLVSKWMLPGLEAALLVALIAANPTRLNRESAVMRAGSLTLTALVSLANGWSAALLAVQLRQMQRFATDYLLVEIAYSQSVFAKFFRNQRKLPPTLLLWLLCLFCFGRSFFYDDVACRINIQLQEMSSQ